LVLLAARAGGLAFTLALAFADLAPGVPLLLLVFIVVPGSCQPAADLSPKP
jgi:hypothetical protein